MSLQRHWSNTPNAYKKSQIAEKGTANPQMIIKWKRDELEESPADVEEEDEVLSPARAFSPMRKVQKKKRRAGTLPRAATDDMPLTPAAAKFHTLTSGISMATDDPNVYAPQGNDPRELRSAQKRLRERYYKGVRTAGPRSYLLAGLDEDYDMGYAHSDGELPPDVRPSSPISASPKMFSGPVSPTGTMMRLDPNNPPALDSGHMILVGAVSKGIIKEKVRPNVGLYQSVYQPNPFGNVTDADLERYKINVERKQKGLPSLEEEEAKRQLEERMAAEAQARQEALKAAKKAGPSPKKSFLGRRPKSDTSGAEATEDTDKEDKKQKKRRRFKLPSFGLKKSDRKKKEGEE
ncbi:Alpha-adducin [Cichlidogyrus casuarinus]|uniref:Alpha-adducin n=1 Tax=Cichlidogyrus casuarinus TaxID=1844966 RepID=A0ABD2QC52_9PLAT